MRWCNNNRQQLRTYRSIGPPSLMQVMLLLPHLVQQQFRLSVKAKNKSSIWSDSIWCIPSNFLSLGKRFSTCSLQSFSAECFSSRGLPERHKRQPFLWGTSAHQQIQGPPIVAALPASETLPILWHNCWTCRAPINKGVHLDWGLRKSGGGRGYPRLYLELSKNSYPFEFFNVVVGYPQLFQSVSNSFLRARHKHH